MTDYTKTTNFAAKDSLPSGNSGKIVKGSEIDTEFNNIATAVATKANIAAPTLTGTVTLTGLLSVPDGTASAPSFTNTGDTNVGLFFSGTDTMAFTAGGTSQVTFADGVIAPVTTNDVDLGTSSLQFKDLFLAGDADFNGNLDVDGTTNLDAVDIDGAVDMASTLNVTGAITGSTATFTTAGNSTGLILKSTDDDSSVGPRFDLVRDSASPADGDVIGQIRFQADNDNGEETTFASLRNVLQDASDGSEAGSFEILTKIGGAMQGRMHLKTTEAVFNDDSQDLDFRVESNNKTNMFVVDGGDDVVTIGGITGTGSGTLKVKSNSSHHAIALEENSGNEAYSLGVVADGSLIFANSGTEVVRFNDSGSVGIGTTDPQTSTKGLHVVHDATEGTPSFPLGEVIIAQRNFNSSQGCAIGIIAGSAGDSGISFGDKDDSDIGKLNYNHGDNSMRFVVNTGEAMRLSSDLRLGLGQTSPATKLDVNGGLHSDHATFSSVAGRGLKISTESRSGQNDGIGVIDAQDTEGDKGIISLQSAGTETMRVMSTSVLIGQTSGSAADEGVILQKTGEAFVTNDGDTALYCRRLTNNGEIINFKKNNVTVGSIGVNSTALFISSPTGNDSGLKFGDRQIVPCTTTGAARDDAINLGSTSNRFDTIHAKSGTIITSDRNEKQDIEELSDAEKRVAVAAKGLLRKYRWKSSVAEKGDDARIHFGIIAQDLEAAFKAEGLDAGRYGMWCSNTFWVDSEGEIYDTQEEAPEGATEQTRLGVRYSQVLAFIIAAI